MVGIVPFPHLYHTIVEEKRFSWIQTLIFFQNLGLPFPQFLSVLNDIVILKTNNSSVAVDEHFKIRGP